MKRIFKKIGLIFALCCVFAVSIINYTLPVKADTETNLNAYFHDYEYFAYNISKYDYTQYYPGERMEISRIYIPHLYVLEPELWEGQQNDYYGVTLIFSVQSDDTSAHPYTFYMTYTSDSGFFEGVLFEKENYLDDNLDNYLVYAHCYKSTQNNNDYLLNYGVVKVGMDMVQDLIFGYIDYFIGGGARITFGFRQFICNDYYTGDAIDGVFSAMDQIFSYSPYKIIAQNNYNYAANLNLNNTIQANWITSILNVISSILAIQILPGVSIGVIVGIPLIFGLLKIILAMWRNNG